MVEILVDSSVILDIFEKDERWYQWSQSTLDRLSENNTLCINPIIYTEVSIGFKQIEELEYAISKAYFRMLQLPKEALFLSGKVFLQYRKNKGAKTSPLPDFFIGAHAAVSNLELVTRDTRKISSYFPKVQLISPAHNEQPLYDS